MCFLHEEINAIHFANKPNRAEEEHSHSITTKYERKKIVRERFVVNFSELGQPRNSMSKTRARASMTFGNLVREKLLDLVSMLESIRCPRPLDSGAPQLAAWNQKKAFPLQGDCPYICMDARECTQ
jgi:hypothetical protein